MPHPLLNNLTELSNEELYAKFAELNKKLSSAYRLGMGEAVFQLNMIREDYQYELDRRSRKELEDLVAKSPDFKNIIDIN